MDDMIIDFSFKFTGLDSTVTYFPFLFSVPGQQIILVATVRKFVVPQRFDGEYINSILILGMYSIKMVHIYVVVIMSGSRLFIKI